MDSGAWMEFLFQNGTKDTTLICSVVVKDLQKTSSDLTYLGCLEMKFLCMLLLLKGE